MWNCICFQVQKVSRASAAFLFWSQTVCGYTLASEEIKPKQQKLAELNAAVESIEEFEKTGIPQKMDLQGTVSVEFSIWKCIRGKKWLIKQFAVVF